MSDQVDLTGRCLCSAIEFQAKGAKLDVGACHCGMCRRWTGGPFMAIDCGTDVSIQGEENIGVFDSSPWAERGFCTKCGTHLFYRIKQTHQYIVPVGIFGDDPAFSFDHQVFIDEKPPYYTFANKTEDMTGAEVFAKYAPKAD